MRFAEPLWFLLLLPLMAMIYYRLKYRVKATVLFPDVKQFSQIATQRTKWLSRLLFLSRTLLFLLIIVALARPQKVFVEKEVLSEGIDIMLALDVSGSMSAEDLKPNNRLFVAKETLRSFIGKREGDRMGLVVFGEAAFTQCPLTIDRHVLLNMVSSVQLNMAGNGTAIGMAIATALNRLKSSDRRSKIIILLTDGENNAGKLSPETAAKLAGDMGVKIYVVGVGKEGGARIPNTRVVTYLDESGLKEIAALSKGRYFRAVDSDALNSIYDQINQLETSVIKTKQYTDYEDLFPSLLKLILWFFLLEILIANVFLVVVP